MAFNPQQEILMQNKYRLKNIALKLGWLYFIGVPIPIIYQYYLKTNNKLFYSIK